MKHIFDKSLSLILASVLVCTVCVQAEAGRSVNIVPWPRSIECSDRVAAVEPKIYLGDNSLSSLSEVLNDCIYRITDFRCKVVSSRPGSGIVFEGAPDMKPGAYSLTVKGERCILRAGSYEGFVHGTASLLQILKATDGMLILPEVDIKDEADYPFRSVLLDLGRFWQPVHTIKETIDLAYIYKLNHLHLHLSDDQSFTFPSKAFPRLKSYFPDGRRRHYTLEELEEIVEYARVRGIVVIPEIDVPSHAGCLTRRMPELFGTVDPETGKAKSTGVINMASEKAYESLDVLIGEVCDVFTTSPYVHIGADEVSPGHLTKLPEYMPYVTKHNLPEARKGNTGELYSHFVVRMNEIVKKHGKKTMAWEGFHGTGTKNARIPKDIVVMVWNMGFNPPKRLLENGYTIINCAWKPLYIVPPQNYMDSQEFTYSWDIHEFQHRRTDIPYSKVATGSDILGAQICYWEQTYEAVIPSLRSHIPVVSERVWNPKAGLEFSDLQKRFADTDKVVEKIMRPVSIMATGLLADSKQTVSFNKTLQVSLSSDLRGVIRYRLDDDWGQFPDAESRKYTGSITIDKTQVVTASLFDENGRLIGSYSQEAFYKIEPAYKYRVFGPMPKGGWSKVPEFSTLKEIRTGVLGYANTERMYHLNRVVFAKNPSHGHIDTQPYRQFNPFALELKGQIEIPKPGEHTFKIRSPFGMAKIYFGDKCVGKCNKPGGQGEITTGHLEAGVYPFRIEYFYSMIMNQLNIQMKTADDDKFESFDKFVLPISKWKHKEKLAKVPLDEVFADPARQKYLNLATDKPVKVSGETQPPNYPENAVDADVTNRSGWHCGSSPQWLEVDLEKQYSINRVKLYTYYDGWRHYRYFIEISSDGKNYTEVVDQRKNTTPSTEKGFEHSFKAVNARYVKVTMVSNSANPGVHINELIILSD